MGSRGFTRWFQFRLRDAAFLCLIVALIAGWWTDRRRLQRDFAATLAQLQGPANWSVEQILGEPDTTGAGDIPTAWASATQDSQREWLVLQFPQAVVPTAVEIHETYNPGAVDRITAWNPQGKEVTVWTGTDPTAPTKSRGVSLIPIRPGFKTNRIKIHLDSPKIPGWNEIDAVGLRDSAGKVQWAAKATASSSYGNVYRSFVQYPTLPPSPGGGPGPNGPGFGAPVPGGSPVTVGSSEYLPDNGPPK